MTRRVLAGLLVALLAGPGPAFAQAPAAEKAGVVTVLEGNVKARRIALPTTPELDLKFKDDVYLRDVVTTGDKSLARMLLGGRAVVTVRERSVLTITEVPGRPTTLELESGKFALAVARERMRPGDEIQIRTPNAVAGVRGTVVITEVERQGAQVGAGVPAAVTNFYVLRGAISAQLLDASRNPFGAPYQVGTMQSFSAAGLATPQVQPVLAEHIARITSGLQPTGQKGGGDTAKDQVKTQQQQQAVALLGALSGERASGPLSSATQTYTAAQYVLPYIPNYVEACKGATSSSSPGTSNSGCEDLLHTLNADLGFAVLSGDLTSTSPLPLFDVVNGSFSFTASFIKLLQGVTVLLGGPLVTFTNSTVHTGGSLFEIQNGTLRSTTSSALISADPTTIFAAQSVLLMNGGTLDLAGPLFTDQNGVIGVLNEFIKMTNNATLTSTGTGALVQLHGTSVSATGALSMANSTMTLNGPLATLANLTDLDLASVVAALGPGFAIGPDAPMFLLDNSQLTSTGLGTLIQIDNSDFDPKLNFLRLINASRMTLAGPLLSVVDAEIATGDPLGINASMIFIGDGSLVQSTTTQPFMSFTNADIDAAGNIFALRRSSAGAATKLVLAGPLLSADNSKFDHTSLGHAATFGVASACCDGVFVGQGAQLVSTTAAPLIQLTNSIVNGSDAQSGGDFFSVQDTFTGAPATELVASSSVNLAGPLLTSTTSAISELFTLLTVRRSTFTGTSANALINLVGGSVTVGGVDPTNGTNTFGRLALVQSAPGSGQAALAGTMTVAGSLLTMNGANLTTNFDVVSAINGGTITGTSTNHFLSLSGSKITQNLPASSQFGGAILSASGLGGPSGTTRSTINLAGGLLTASNNSILSFPGRIVVASGGGQIFDTHPTSPFVGLSGGAHTLGTLAQFPGAFGLFGRAGAGFEATETHLTLNLSIGQDQPLVRSGTGAFLELTNGATVNTHEAVRVDTAVLSATAPLFDVRSSSTLTTATDAINLNQRARLTTVAPSVRIDGGVMNVVNNNLFRVAGGSALVASTDLISITNGGTLNITNGAAILVSGTSAVNITGSLLNFGTVSGNTVNVTNGTVPNLSCGAPCGGLSVGFINGAAVAQVSIANPIKNLGSNVVNVGASSSIIIIDGTTARLTIAGN